MVEQPLDVVQERRRRIEELEAFVQRFIDVGYEFGDPTLLVDLHDEAVALLPESRDADKMTPDELRALADRKEAKECSGMAASWCPVHGDCSCPTGHQFEWPTCPLHGEGSNHAGAT